MNVVPDIVLVDGSYDQAVHILDSSIRALFYPDGAVRIEHRCRNIGGRTVVAAPRLQLAEGRHRVVAHLPLSVDPSILCPDCGLHGFIRSGRWVPA